MLNTDLTLDPSTSISAGTNAPKVFSLLGSDKSRSTRSVAAQALTFPLVLSIAHSTRAVKGLKTKANASVPASDVIFDRRLVRTDENVAQTTHNDPEYRVNFSVQLVLDVPRLGAESPTVVAISDRLKSIVGMLTASSNANLIRVLNGEL